MTVGYESLAKISIVTDTERVVVSGGDTAPGGSEFEGIKLSEDPEDMYDTELELKTISVPGVAGGRDGGEEVPVREMVLPFNLYDTGDGIEATISRLRKLLWNKRFKWVYETEHSGERWLKCRRSKSIQIQPKRDPNLDSYLLATVHAVALNPYYESQHFAAKVANTTAGTTTFWIPAWNPTDQWAWPIWSLWPNGGAATFQVPDFGFGYEQDIDATWTPGQHSNRMVVVKDIEIPWSLMADRVMDTYVAADLSNAPGQMGGVDLLYGIPPYTGTEADPIMLPVVINGPAGAAVRLRLRRFWSAEMGLE